jgi:alpha-tubulin suppressor-like RCC1 family protein
MGGAGAGGIEGDKLYAWGNNGNGQLGLGNTTDRSSPNQVGSLSEWAEISGSQVSSFAIKGDNTLWSWGNNFPNGELGSGTTTNRSSPVQVGSLSNWAKVAGSGFYSCTAIKTDGTLWTWGEGRYGQLGSGNTTNRSSPAQVGSLTNWSKISQSNGYHFLSIKTDGTLWVWGGSFYNYGELGLGDTVNRSSPTQVGALTDWLNVAGGYAFSLGVRSNGTLWSWGRNADGQLGLGNTTDYSSPVQIGSATNWAFVAAGFYHSIAVKTNGTIWAWGKNDLGQLGVGDTTNRSSPVQIGSLTNWSSVDCGTKHTVAIKTDGTIWSWGMNNTGQLGHQDATNKSSPVQIGSLTTWTKAACGATFSLALSD